METTLRRMGETLGALRDALAEALAEGAWRPDAWPPIMWWWMAALVVLLALAALRRGRPRPLEVRPPQLLITQGEVVPDEPSEAPARRRRANDPSAAQAGLLTMTVSNLSRYPVQLLEVALREESRGAPRIAEVEAVVPAMGAVDVAVHVPLAMRGDGWLDLYCYAAAPRHKTHRHRAELVWEPWASRFKVAPLEQVVAPVRRLASDERQARFDTASVPAATPAPVAVPVRAARVATARPAAEPRAARAVAEARRQVPADASGRDDARVAAPAAPVTDVPAARPSGEGVDAPRAEPLGALWARLPRLAPRQGGTGGARDAVGADEPGEAVGPAEDPGSGGGEGRGRTDVPQPRPDATVAAERPRVRLEFPDDF